MKTSNRMKQQLSVCAYGLANESMGKPKTYGCMGYNETEWKECLIRFDFFRRLLQKGRTPSYIRSFYNDIELLNAGMLKAGIVRK